MALPSTLSERTTTKAKRKIPKMKFKREVITEKHIRYIILGVSIAVAIVFFVLYVMSAPIGPTGIAIHKADISYLSIGLLILVGPYGFYVWYKDHIMNALEDKFAEFLRDLAEYWKVGLSMTTAIETISRGEYGALNKEVQKMATQISWGVGFNEVLRNLVKRVGTKLIARSVSLVDEANKAGGKISDVLTTAANDAAEIKWLQKERKRGVTMYVAVIYISFGVYLAVIAIIVAVFLPAIIDASQSMIAGGAGAGAAMGGLQVRVLEREKLTFLFFCSVIVQSIGNGLMAGLMGEGKVTAGLKHVFLMVLIGWLIFWAMGTYM